MVKQKEKRKCCWLFGVFFLMLLYPLGGKVLDEYFSLNGVSAKIEKPVVTAKTLLDGSYQEEINSYLLGELPGRNLLVRVHNQLLYSVFRVSSNSNIVIGDNNQLFEPEYLEYSLNIWEQPLDEDVATLVNKLLVLSEALEKEGKQLYIFITPSKARYYAEDAPLAYKLCGDEQRAELAYDKFIRELNTTDIKVFDSISYIDEHRDDFDFPLWYSTGIHWSRALGSEVAVEFNKYLRETSGYDLGQIKVTHEKTSEITEPDADLYQTLNLLVQPEKEYYTQKFTLVEGTDKPNVFLRGGSFMGQSLNCLILNEIFEKDIYFQNNFYATDRFSNRVVLSDFNSYDELDVEKYLEQSDILVLEVNENKIFMMSWGFIDYLLNYYEDVKGE